MGTVPISTGESADDPLAGLVDVLAVDRSITVSPPSGWPQVILSTSSLIEEPDAELPMLALILTRKLRPMIIGWTPGWLMLLGMMARPRATSERTNSGVISAGMLAPKKCWPLCWRVSSLAIFWPAGRCCGGGSRGIASGATFRGSPRAFRLGVMIPWRA